MITNDPRKQRDLPKAGPATQAFPGTADIPALAFGSGLTALGVLRSLHASGITVFSSCPPGDLPSKSRWYRPAPTFGRAAPQPEQLPEYLDSLPIRHAVLFPCADDWARAIADLPTYLRRRFPASISSPSVIETMTDKWRFFTFAECIGIPRPETLRVDSMEELEAVEEAACRNRFLKPVDSQEFSRKNRVKAFQIDGKEHALEIMEKVRRTTGGGFPILLQEYIPGPPTNS
jgi:predicted ATP-grasp superfamily ATP-dependent carboligase